MAVLPLARTILLLGGTGFIGTNFAARLHEAGHRVFVAGRRLLALDGRPAIDLPLANTARITNLIEAERIDTVVHLACGLLPSSTEAGYFEERVQVYEPTVRLARWLADHSIAFVFLSSGGTVYGAATAPCMGEDDPCSPINLYGQAKLEIESHLSFLARTRGLRLLTLRPSNPYGIYQSLHGVQGLVSVILGRIADKRPLEVWGDGSVVRDYIMIDDATLAMRGLIERNAVGVFNIGSGVGHSLLEVVRAIEEATGQSVPLHFNPSRQADVPRLILDTTRLAKMNLHYSRPFAQGVAEYAAQLGMARAR